MAALLSNPAGSVVLGTFSALWWVGFQEHVGVEVRSEATFLAYHFLDAAVKLDSNWPSALDVEGNFCLQWCHGCLDSVDVLGIQALQTVLLAQAGEHLVEFRRSGLFGLNIERPDQFVEGRRQGVILVDSSIE